MTLIPASAVYGICISLRWAAQGSYVTNLAIQYAKVTEQLQQDVITQFSSIYFGILQISEFGFKNALYIKPACNTLSSIVAL